MYDNFAPLSGGAGRSLCLSVSLSLFLSLTPTHTHTLSLSQTHTKSLSHTRYLATVEHEWSRAARRSRGDRGSLPAALHVHALRRTGFHGSHEIRLGGGRGGGRFAGHSLSKWHVRFHMETLIICKLGSMDFTTPNDLC